MYFSRIFRSPKILCYYGCHILWGLNLLSREIKWESVELQVCLLNCLKDSPPSNNEVPEPFPKLVCYPIDTKTGSEENICEGEISETTCRNKDKELIVYTGKNKSSLVRHFSSTPDVSTEISKVWFLYKILFQLMMTCLLVLMSQLPW